MATDNYMCLNDYYQLFSKHFKKVSLAAIARETATKYQILKNLSTRPKEVDFDTQLMTERLFWLDAKVRGWV